MRASIDRRIQIRRRAHRYVRLSCLLLLASTLSASAAGLRGGATSIGRQNDQAKRHDFTYLVTRSQLQRFVSRGWLVRLRGDSNYMLKGVSFPYARPEVKLFVERLSQQYRAACGEQLVVTSLTRPKNYQPPNASPRSVHPTGMALDLRRSRSQRCRSWIERVLLSLEGKGVLEATRERWPPHYHVAVYPKPYRRYVETLGGQTRTATYRVGNGDTLWRIARKHRVSVDTVKAQNGLRSNVIYPGQVLKLPVGK